MSAFDIYINRLVSGEKTNEDFPKNESSWEELFNFGKCRIVEIVELRRELSAYERLELAVSRSLQNLYATRIMESQLKNVSIPERYSFTNPADAMELETAINELAAALEALKVIKK